MKTKVFRLFQLAKILNKFAEVFYFISFISIVFTLTHSPLFIVFISCFVLIGKYIGNVVGLRLANNYIFSTQFIKIIVLVLFFILVINNHAASIPLMVLSFVIATLDGFFLHNMNTLQSFISRREDMLVSNGFHVYLDPLILLSSWIIGSLLFLKGNSEIVLFVAIILSTASLIIFYAMPSQNSTIHLRNNQKDNGKNIHIVNVIEIVVRTSWMAVILFLLVHHQIFWWGILNSVFFCGIVFAYFLLMKFHPTFVLFEQKILIINTLCMGIIMFGMSFTTQHLWMSIFVFLGGTTSQIRETILSSRLIKKGIFRQNGLFFTCVSVTSLLTFGLIINIFGVSSLYLITSILTILLGFYYLFGEAQHH
ncbi:hypothetical protein HV419_04895 [Bacillus sporothermodurans]|uniref:hypothetical protein n=1 Tax=Heyndrickxia sporothermodurans TaxID=46224 RepID=UPI00192B13BC|nr:hypothetical protein [Heyndrickxia sporothermodurans]MBL5813654.1 hypothetical protein [Heyndrickxia sporothermodurans]